MKIKNIRTVDGFQFDGGLGFFIGKPVNLILRIESDGEVRQGTNYDNPINLYFNNVEVDSLPE